MLQFLWKLLARDAARRCLCRLIHTVLDTLRAIYWTLELGSIVLIWGRKLETYDIFCRSQSDESLEHNSWKKMCPKVTWLAKIFFKFWKSSHCAFVIRASHLHESRKKRIFFSSFPALWSCSIHNRYFKIPNISGLSASARVWSVDIDIFTRVYY